MVFDRRADEFAEQRIRAEGARSEFGMELGSDEEGMIFQLNDFSQPRLRVDAGEDHVRILELFLERIVKFVTMAMPLADVLGLIALIGKGSRLDVAVVCTQAKSSAHIDSLVLVVEEIDDGVFGFRIEFSRVCFLQAQDVLGELDDGKLHPKANAEEGDLMFPGVAEDRKSVV